MFALKYLTSTAPTSGGAFNIPLKAVSLSMPNASATPIAIATLSGKTIYPNSRKYDSGTSSLSTTINFVLRRLATLAKNLV